MDKPIDRTKEEDLLKQVGYVNATIASINTKISKIDKELIALPKRIDRLKKDKQKLIDSISKKHKYINELEHDIWKNKWFFFKKTKPEYSNRGACHIVIDSNEVEHIAWYDEGGKFYPESEVNCNNPIKKVVYWCWRGSTS